MQQVAPGLGEGLRGVVGQPFGAGEGGEGLGLFEEVLGGPVGLFHVGVRDVLARVDRAHLPGDGQRALAARREFGADRVEVGAGAGVFHARPAVAAVPGVLHVQAPAVRPGEVGAHRDQHVLRRGGGAQQLVQVQQLLGGGLGVRGRVGEPAGGVVRGQVVQQQARAPGRDPLVLGGQLHDRGCAQFVAPGVHHRAPLVVGAAGEDGGVEAGAGHQGGEGRVVAEDVELPGGARVGAEGAAVQGEAVDGAADGGLGGGEVGGGLVVRAADDLHAALGDQRAQLGAVGGVGVPVGLEVVDLGEHEAVRRVLAGLLEVERDQREGGDAGVLPAALGLAGLRGDVPEGGVGGLGVPPHGVVVEVRDEADGPAGLGDDQAEGPVGERAAVGGGDADGGGQDGPGGGAPGADGDLDGGLRGGAGCRQGCGVGQIGAGVGARVGLGGVGAHDARVRGADAFAVHGHVQRTGRTGPADAHPDHLRGICGRAAEERRGVDRRDRNSAVHFRTLPCVTTLLNNN